MEAYCMDYILFTKNTTVFRTVRSYEKALRRNGQMFGALVNASKFYSSATNGTKADEQYFSEMGNVVLSSLKKAINDKRALRGSNERIIEYVVPAYTAIIKYFKYNTGIEVSDVATIVLRTTLRRYFPDIGIFTPSESMFPEVFSKETDYYKNFWKISSNTDSRVIDPIDYPLVIGYTRGKDKTPCLRCLYKGKAL